jgi:hypothetical protein
MKWFRFISGRPHNCFHCFTDKNKLSSPEVALTTQATLHFRFFFWLFLGSYNLVNDIEKIGRGFTGKGLRQLHTEPLPWVNVLKYSSVNG